MPFCRHHSFLNECGKKTFSSFSYYLPEQAQIFSLVIFCTSFILLLIQKCNFDKNFILINLNSMIHYEWENFFLFTHFLSCAAAMIIMPFLFYLFSWNLIFFSFESIKKIFFAPFLFILIFLPTISSSIIVIERIF